MQRTAKRSKNGIMIEIRRCLGSRWPGNSNVSCLNEFEDELPEGGSAMNG